LKVDDALVAVNMERGNEHIAFHMPGLAAKGWIMEKTWVLNVGPAVTHLSLRFVALVVNRILQPAARIAALATAANAVGSRHDVEDTELGADELEGARWVIEVRLASATQPVAHDAAGSHEGSRAARSRVKKRLPQIFLDGDEHFVVLLQLGLESVAGVSIASAGAAITIPQRRRSVQAEGNIVSTRIFMLEQQGAVIELPSISVKVLYSSLGLETVLPTDSLDRWLTHSPSASQTFTDNSMNPKNAVTELPLLIDVAIPSILFRLDYATDFGVSVQNIVRFSKATEVLLASFLSYHEDGTTLPPQQGSTSPSVPAHDIAAVCVEVSIEHIEFECADEEDTASERRNLGTFVAHSIDVQFCISLSKEQLYEQMRSLDNATVTPPIADFKSIFGGNLMSLSVGTFHFLLADIPIPFVAIDNLTAQGSVILSELKVVPRFEYKCPVRVAENVYSGAAPTMIDIALPIPSLKFFHDIDVTIERGMVMLSGQQEHILAKHFGPRMERVAPPRADPSAKLPPWDVVRFLFHGFVGARANSFNLLMVPGYPHNLAGLNVSVEDVTFRNRQRQPLEISAHNVAATCIHLKEQYGSATKSRGYFMESDTTKLYQSVGVFLKIPCVQFAAKFDWLSRGDRHNHYVHLQRVDAASATLAHQLVQKEHSSVLPTSPVQPRPEPTRDLWNPPCQGDTFFWFRSLRANVRFAIHLLASDGKALGEQVEPSCYVNQERSAHLHTIVRLLRDNVEPAELRDKVKFSQLWRNMQLEIQTSSFVLLWWENLHSIDHVQFGMSDFDCTIELANDLHYPLMEAKRLPQSSLQNMNLKTSEIQVGHGFSIPESPDFDHTKDKSVFLYASALSILIDRRDLSQRVDEEQNDSTSSENKNSFVCEDFRGLWNMRNRDLGFSFGTSMFQFGVGFSPMSAEMVSPNEVEEIAPDIAQDDPLPLQREVTLTPMEKILLQDETSTSPTTTASVASVWMESFRIHFQNVTLHFVAEEWDSAVSVYAHNACATKYVRTSENTTKLSATNTSGTPLPEKWEFQLSKVDAVNAATDIQIQTKLSRQSPHFYPSLIHRVIKNFEIRVDFVTNLDGGQSSSIAVFIPRLHVDATSYDFTTFVSVIQYVLIVKPSATSDDSVHDVEKQSPRMFSTIFNLSNPDITSNGEHAALCACRWDRYVVYDPVLNSVPAWSERGVSLNNRNGWPSLMTALDDCATIDINAAVVLPQHGVEDISFNPNQPDVSINWFCGPYCIETPLSDQSYTDDVAPVVSDSAKARAVRLSAHKRWKRLPAEFLEGVDAAVCCRMWPPYVDVGGSRDCLVVYLFRKHWYVAYDCRADQVIGGVMSIRDGFPSSKSSYVPVELPAVHAAFSLNDKVFLVYGREYVCPQESRHPRRLRSRFAFASDHLFSENAGLKQPHDLPGKMTLAVEACLKETSTFRPGGGRKSIDYNICVESIQLQLLDQAQQIFGTLDLTKTTVNAKLFDDGSMNLDSRICTVRIHESAAVAEVRRAASKADAASTQVDDEPTNNTGPRKYALTWTFLGPTNVAPDDSLLDREMISVQARTIALQSTRWANDKSVSLVQFFEIDLFPGMHSSQHPESTPILDLNMTRSLYKKVWAYFFPTKSRRNAVSAGSDPLMLDSAPQSASAIKSPKSGDKHPAAGVASGPKGSQTRFGRRNTEGSAIHSAYFNPVQQHKVANGRSDKLKFFYFKTAKIGAIRVILSAHGFPIKVDRWKLKLDSFRLTSSLMTSDDVADSLKHSYVKILMKAAGKLAFGKLNNRKVTKHPNQLLSRTMILDTSESKKAPPRSRQWKCVLGGFLRIGPNQSKHPSRETHSIRPGDLFTELERVDERSRCVVAVFVQGFLRLKLEFLADGVCRGQVPRPALVETPDISRQYWVERHSQQIGNSKAHKLQKVDASHRGLEDCFGRRRCEQSIIR